MSAVADPTMQTLKALDDPGRWQVIENVPVFAAHRKQKKLRDGSTKDVVVSEDRLHDIVTEARRREREDGLVPMLYLGHRNPDPDFPEAKQPDGVGFARNWRVGKWGPKKKTAILVDLYYDRRHWDEAKKAPYRSVEFYDVNNQITGVALLKRDPELDLGVISFARTGEPILYEGDPTEPPAKPDPKDEGDDKPAEEGKKGEEDEDRFSPEDEEHYQRFARCMKRYMAAIGPSNGMLPAPVKKEAGLDRSGEPDRLQRSQEAMQYQRLQGQLASLDRRLKEAEAARENDALRYARNEASLIVEGLSRDGYQLGGPEKVKSLGERMARMSAGERLDYEREVRDNWARAPVGGDWFNTGTPPAKPGQATGVRGNEDSPQAQLAEAEAVVNYMRDQGETDYDRARQAVREKKAA